MGSLSVWHWLLFLAVALLMFGGSGKISSIMGDVAKGIKSFKKGMAEDDETAKKDEPPKVLEGVPDDHALVLVALCTERLSDHRIVGAVEAGTAHQHPVRAALGSPAGTAGL